MRHTLVRYLPLVLLALFWEFASRFGLVSSSALPPLSDVVVSWVDLLRSGDLFSKARRRCTGPAQALAWRSWSARCSAS